MIQDSEFTPFDYWRLSICRSGNLPHWQQDNVIYFITFRLADSIPLKQLRKLKNRQEEWLESHQQPYSEDELKEYYHLFYGQIQHWLDIGNGACILSQPEIALIIANSLQFFDGDKYCLDEWVIMPNHAHILVQLMPGEDLKKITHSWKSFSAHQINKILMSTGPVWKKESFDHIVRNLKQLNRIRKYIRENPEKAGIEVNFASWIN